MLASLFGGFAGCPGPANSLCRLARVVQRAATARSEELPMYIGIGTVVLIVIIVLIILALRR
jgi:hypothetical protein